MISNHLSRFDLSKLAGVSRAAVTKWFRHRGPWVNVETKTIIQLASALGLPPDLFLKPRGDLSGLETRFLWDRLYPSMEAFVGALVVGDLPALARLVQVLGFRDSAAVVGPRAIRSFSRYKNFLKPARRRQLETLWPLYNSPM